jgi:hypothetical protein
MQEQNKLTIISKIQLHLDNCVSENKPITRDNYPLLYDLIQDFQNAKLRNADSDVSALIKSIK